MAKRLKRLIFDERVCDLIEGSLENVQKQLQEVLELGKDYSSLWLEHDEYNIWVQGKRKENDEEFNKREEKRKKKEEKVRNDEIQKLKNSLKNILK